MSLPPPSTTVEAPLDEPTTPTPVIKKKPARRTLARDLADLRFDIERITDRQKSMQIRSPGPSRILPYVSSQQKSSLPKTPKSTPAKRKRVTATTDAVTPPKKKQAKTEPTESPAASPSPSTSPSPKRIAKRKRSFTNTATPKKLNLDEEKEIVDIVGLSPNAPPAPLDVENHLDSPALETSPEKTERPVETPKKKIRSLKKEAEALKEEMLKWDRRNEDENRRKGSILHLFPKDDDKEGAKTPRTRKPKAAGLTTKDKPQGNKRGRPPKRKPQPEEALEAENDEKEEESPLEESELEKEEEEKEDEADKEVEDKEEEKGQEESQGDEEEGSAKEEEEKGGSQKRRRTRSEAELAYLNTDKERLERRARVRNEKEKEKETEREEETKSTPKKASSASSTPVRVAKRRRSRLPAETMAKDEVEEVEEEREEETTTTPTKTTPRKKSRGRSEVERLKLENERELSRADSRKLRAFGTPQANRVSESARIIDKARKERVRREKEKMQRKQDEKKEQEKKANKKKAVEEARRKKEEAEEEKKEVPQEEEKEEEEDEEEAPTLTLEIMKDVFHQTRSLLQLVGDSRLVRLPLSPPPPQNISEYKFSKQTTASEGGCQRKGEEGDQNLLGGACPLPGWRLPLHIRQSRYRQDRYHHRSDRRDEDMGKETQLELRRRRDPSIFW